MTIEKKSVIAANSLLMVFIDIPMTFLSIFPYDYYFHYSFFSLHSLYYFKSLLDFE